MRFWCVLVPQRVLTAGLLVLALPAAHAIAAIFLPGFDVWWSIFTLAGQLLASVIIAVWTVQTIYHRDRPPPAGKVRRARH